MMQSAIFTEPISTYVWNTRYRLSEGAVSREPDMRETWSRVALALSKLELFHRDEWRVRFEAALAAFRFIPGGRILAGAGTQRRMTLFNCFVMGTIHDSVDAIFSALGESMVTMAEGGGIGCDFSTLRPARMAAGGSGNAAPGPVSFMRLWDRACATLTSSGIRGGAMMATLRCDHPDIERFVEAKCHERGLQHFNLSVLISDEFMRAVDEDAPWALVFPLAGHPIPPGGRVCQRVWSGGSEAEPCLVMKTVGARDLWKKLLRAAFACGDPGVIFIDRVQQADNLWYAGQISATNPCGEVPMPAHGACNLGSINLTQFVRDPFGRHPHLDLHGIADVARIAVRMLDNVIDVSHFPLAAQARNARVSRRIGLGITGLADMFAMLGVRYGAESSLEIAETVMQTICYSAYRTSIALAEERGVFPAYRAKDYLSGIFIAALPRDILQTLQRHGIRNSHLTAIAPAGSISLLANNVSSGIEPIYACQAERTVRMPNGSYTTFAVHDYAWSLFRKIHGDSAALPAYFVEAHDVDALAQLKLQARLQNYVDQSISKTINFPANATFDHCENVFTQAYRLGLKGCTSFCDDPSGKTVLSASCKSPASQACA
jgi:ribonucleoside-diphosphate reductase alpha chain